MANLPTSFVAAGAYSSSGDTSPITLAVPSGANEGMVLYALIITKSDAAATVSATDWTEDYTSAALGGGTTGTGVGPVTLHLMKRVVPAGGLSGTVDFTVTGGNSYMGVMVLFSYDITGYTAPVWEAVTGVTYSRTTGSTTFGGTGSANLNLDANDFFVFVSVSSDDQSSNHNSAANHTLTATGTTLGTLNNLGTGVTTTGGDCSMFVSHRSVTTGPSTAAPVATLTANSSETGGGIFLRVRATGTDVTPKSATETATVSVSESSSVFSQETAEKNGSDTATVSVSERVEILISEGGGGESIWGAWSYNEGTGTTAANSGTSGVNLSTVPGWSASGHTSACQSRTSAGTGSTLVIPSALGNTWTFMGWFKPRNAGGWSSLWEGPNAIYLEINGLTLDFNGDPAGTIAGGTLTADTWVHLAISVSATTTRLVKNGTQVGTASSYVPLDAGTYMIGGSSGQPYNGEVDDIRIIVGSALTDGEITTLMDTPVGAGGPATVTRVFFGTETATVSVTESASVDAGGEPIPQSASDTATISVTESATVIPTIPYTASDTATISVSESASVTPITNRYIRSVSANGRYFLDQDSNPILVRGDSPWGALFNNTPAQLESYWNALKEAGFNAAICSLLPDTDNGAVNSTGKTQDGIAPFTTFPTLNSTYWERMDAHIDMAAQYGITLFMYPVDSWTVVNGAQAILQSATNTQLATYATTLANRYSSKPNIVWMIGGDYWEPSNDDQFRAVVDAIRTTLGSSALIGAQLLQPTWTTRSGGNWTSSVVNYNFIYVYDVAYDLTQQAYNQVAIPALMSENRYLNEGVITTTGFRKNTLWAYVAGSPGDIVGNSLWGMGNLTNWQNFYVNSPNANFFQHTTYANWFQSLTGWWELVPNTGDTFITSGRGTKRTRTNFTKYQDDDTYINSNDYAAAALKADGSMAVAYVPTQRAITLNTALLGSNPVGKWINPTTLAETSISDLSVSITPPSSGDWLLYITAGAAATPKSGTDTATVSVTESTSLVINQATPGSDTATVSVTESTSILVTVGRTDTATVSVTEAQTSQSSVSRTDTATISVTESVAQFVTVNTTDSPVISVAEGSSLGGAANVPGSDTATVTVTESPSISGLAATADTAQISVTEVATKVVTFQVLATADTATVSVTEAQVSQSSLSRTDTATVSVTEVAASSGTMSSTDTATVSITEAATPSVVGSNPATNDIAQISVAEVANIAVTEPGADTATISVVETRTIDSTVSRTDTAQPSVTETRVVAVSSSSTDTAAIVVAESANVLVTSDTKTAADTAQPSVTESVNLFVNRPTTDSPIISVTESSNVVVRISASDNVTVTASASGTVSTGIPFEVAAWLGTQMVNGQFRVWDGTQMLEITRDQVYIWNGSTMIPLTSL